MGGFDPFIAPDPELYFIGNLLRDFTLNRQQVARFAIVLSRPKVGLIFHLDELCGDSQSARVTPDTALQRVLTPNSRPI